jgi:hypothetical protein
MLGRLLAAGVEDLRIDVRDLAALYYRLLRLDVNEAARVVNSGDLQSDIKLASENKLLMDELFNEFNSLSIVFNKPALKFVGEDEEEQDEESDEEDSDDDNNEDEETDVSTQPEYAPEMDVFGAMGAAAPQEAAVSADGGFDIMGGFGFGDVVSSPSPAAPAFSFQPNPSCDAKIFQDTWTSTQAPPEGVLSLTLATPAKARDLEPTLKQNHFVTMASGPAGDRHKFYFYCQDETGALFYMEILMTRTGQMSITAKSLAQDRIGLFVDAFKNAIASLL